MLLCTSRLKVQIVFIFNDVLSSHEGLRLLPIILSGVQRGAEKGSGGRMIGSL